MKYRYPYHCLDLESDKITILGLFYLLLYCLTIFSRNRYGMVVNLASIKKNLLIPAYQVQIRSDDGYLQLQAPEAPYPPFAAWQKQRENVCCFKKTLIYFRIYNIKFSLLSNRDTKLKISNILHGVMSMQIISIIFECNTSFEGTFRRTPLQVSSPFQGALLCVWGAPIPLNKPENGSPFNRF